MLFFCLLLFCLHSSEMVCRCALSTICFCCIFFSHSSVSNHSLVENPSCEFSDQPNNQRDEVHSNKKNNSKDRERKKAHENLSISIATAPQIYQFYWNVCVCVCGESEPKHAKQTSKMRELKNDNGTSKRRKLKYRKNK